MNIHIIEVTDRYLVFKGHCGLGVSHHTCANDLVIGSEQSVEFDIMTGLHTKENTRIGTSLQPGFYREDDFTVIAGSVESIDEDDVICLRIATDCIIIGWIEDPTIVTGDMLEIRLHKDQLLITVYRMEM